MLLSLFLALLALLGQPSSVDQKPEGVTTHQSTAAVVD